METTDPYGRKSSQFSFAFANATTGEIDYTATLAMIDGELVAQFANVGSTALGSAMVSVVGHDDTSKAYTFANPYGSGSASVTVTAPAIYANVVATLANLVDELEVYQETGIPTTYIIDYYDADGRHHFETPLSETAVSGLTSPIVGAGYVQFVATLMDAQGISGTDTYTISLAESMAVDAKETTDAYGEHHAQYEFAFFDVATGKIDHTATLAAVDGELLAQFASADGTTLGSQSVAVVRHADTSQTYTFANPYGSEGASVAVTTPVIYTNIVATLANLPGKLTVYQEAGEPATYIIDYYDFDGRHHFEGAMNGRIQSLYTSDGGDNVLRLTAGISLSERIGTTTVLYFATPLGFLGEQTSVGGANKYKVHVLDTATGLDKAVIDIVDLSSTISVARFESPLNDVALINWMEGDDSALEFTFDNAVGSGTLTLLFDGSRGNINAIAFQRP